MSEAFSDWGFGARGFEGGRAGASRHFGETIEHLKSMFDPRAGSRMARGDVRAAILALLAEQPMHGYQIIAEIEKRSGGAWKPSPGSVYPTLQLLADEGLISAEAADGRKTYSLTESGRAEAEAAERAAPWETNAQRDPFGMGPLPKSGVALAQAAAQLRQSGTPEQVEQGVAILDEARRRIYAILAQD